MNSYGWRVQPLIDRYKCDLPRRQAIKIAAQVDQLRSDRERSPEFQRLWAIYVQLSEARYLAGRAQDIASERIVVDAMNAFYCKRLEAYKGDAGQMEDTLAQAYLLRKQHHRDRSASDRVRNQYHLQLQMDRRSGV